MDFPMDLDELLHKACAVGDLGKVRHLLTSPEVFKRWGHYANLHSKRVADYGCIAVTPLCLACQGGHLPVVRYLLTSLEVLSTGAKHAKIDFADQLPLNLACYHGHLAVVRYVLTSDDLEQKAHINPNSLWSAYIKGHKELVHYLLESPEIAHHARIDARTDEGKLELWFNMCKMANLDILHYIIFDYKLQADREMKKISNRYPKIRKMFQMRDSFEHLVEHLVINPSMSKKAKL